MANILYAEDDFLLADLLSEILSNDGKNSITHVINGEEALEKLRHTLFHLVITDNHMKGMGGEELIPEIRKLYPHLPIIGCSGSSWPDSILATAGFYRLDKPFSNQQALSLVEHVLHQQ